MLANDMQARDWMDAVVRGRRSSTKPVSPGPRAGKSGLDGVTYRAGGKLTTHHPRITASDSAQGFGLTKQLSLGREPRAAVVPPPAPEVVAAPRLKPRDRKPRPTPIP
jgi:hypothetical protein